MSKLQFLLSRQTNPYWNVSIENYLLSLPEEDTITLYLWKNHRTVVIGQNQNPYSECNVDLLEADGGYVMRRATGGGAVYHDDGNINFSFIAPKALYDQAKQFSVICRAVESFGLGTSLSGRNDILCEGRKFSGNAFAKARYQNLHHGTILIKGNMKDLQRYLKVRPAKLQKHGVASVSSRVVNLSELIPPTPQFPNGITSDNIVEPLLLAFQEVYGGKAEHLDYYKVIETQGVRNLYDKFSSDEWRFGKWRSFRAQRSAQFEWGNVDIAVQVDEAKSIITDIQIASDGLDLASIEAAKSLLFGASTKVKPAVPNPDDTILNDIINLIY